MVVWGGVLVGGEAGAGTYAHTHTHTHTHMLWACAKNPAKNTHPDPATADSRRMQCWSGPHPDVLLC